MCSGREGGEVKKLISREVACGSGRNGGDRERLHPHEGGIVEGRGRAQCFIRVKEVSRKRKGGERAQHPHIQIMDTHNHKRELRRQDFEPQVLARTTHAKASIHSTLPSIRKKVRLTSGSR